MSVLDDVAALLKLAVDAVTEASRKLDDIKKDLGEKPKVDTSATDATAKEFGK